MQPPRVSAQADSEACADSNQMCDAWARNGQCKINRSFMNTNCRKACGLCTAASAPCADSFKDCQSISRQQGACDTEFMKQSCRRTCGFCTPAAPTGVARHLRGPAAGRENKQEL